MDRHGYNRAPNKPSGLWVTVQGRDDIPCVAGSKCQTTKHACAFPRRAQRPSPALHAPSIKRAQGMPGAGRTRSLAWKSKNHTSQSPQVRRNDPALPARMVLTVSFVLSPETGLSCLRRRRNIIRRLDASVGASGPYDFAVRKARVLVRNAARVHRIPPHVRDDRETPLCWDGTIWLYCCFYLGTKRKISSVGARRETGDLPVGQVTRSPAPRLIRTDHRKALDTNYPTG